MKSKKQIKRRPSSTVYSKKRGKQRKKSISVWHSLFVFMLWVLAIASSVTIAVLLIAPSSGGSLGAPVANALLYIFGYGAYILPFLLLYGFIRLLLNAKGNFFGVITLLIAIMLVQSALSCQLAVLKHIFTKSQIDSGFIGAVLSEFFIANVGVAGAIIFSLAILLAGLHILFSIPWAQTIKWFMEVMKEDYAQWIEGRAKLRAFRKEIKGASLRPAAAGVSSSVMAGDAPVADKEIIVRRGGKVSPLKGSSSGKDGNDSDNSSEVKNDAFKTEAKKPETEIEVVTDFSYKPYNIETFQLPSLNLIKAVPHNRHLGPSDEDIARATELLESTLNNFEINASVTGVTAGPVITRYELKPQRGVKVSSVVSLVNDIALAMKARAIRVEAPIPGKDAIGFEIPNDNPVMVYLREILEDDSFKNIKSKLGIALGRYSDGTPASGSLEKMPHLLVAGATNSGKSICLQTIILSILFRANPDEVKFLMIDPKRLELTFYENIPHLYDPKTSAEEAHVITKPGEADASLKALVKVMESRYKILEMAKVKNISSYNAWARQNGEKEMFYIVVIIDELADLMLQTKASIEEAIQRLAQMARAVGIHLVISTQRPSVNVITGTIKANLPSRIALQVASKIDSKVILDTSGAEALLGKGDMLYSPIDAQKPLRLQGAYVSEEEITQVADFLRAQGGPCYPDEVCMEQNDATIPNVALGGINVEDFKSALKLILERRRISQDLLKAHFGSSARATNILSVLEMQGFINKPEGTNRWEINFEKIQEQLNMLTNL